MQRNDVHPRERNKGKLASEGHDHFGLESSICLLNQTHLIQLIITRADELKGVFD